MSNKKFRCPLPNPNGRGTFSNNLVGNQVTNGGGLTQGNFEFTSKIIEKSNRNFTIGSFSKPITLDNISDFFKSDEIYKEKKKYYLNYDLNEINNFTLYGSLTTRIEASLKKIINFFPASIIVSNIDSDFNNINTAYDIIYDSIENTTTFSVDVRSFINHFSIEYSKNADNNISVLGDSVSQLRNLKKFFKRYVIFDYEKEYNIIDLTPSENTDNGFLEITVEGKLFDTEISTSKYEIKPNKINIKKSYDYFFDKVEKYLLTDKGDRYESIYKIVEETSKGNFIENQKTITWTKEGSHNPVISGFEYERFLVEIKNISENVDSFKTDLINRFLVSGSILDFDTSDQKVSKLLNVYGRGFDETKTFIDSLAYINSISYTNKNDIPSFLLKNIAHTLGWNDTINPLKNKTLLSNIFTTNSVDKETPEELSFDFYRNLILNTSYLFKSKGTRRSIEFILRLAGAPKSLIEFNETVYIADGELNIEKYTSKLNKLENDGFIEELFPTNSENISILGNEYPTSQSDSRIITIDFSLLNYPFDDKGFPKPLSNNNNLYFQKGAGWYKSTPQHRSNEIRNENGDVILEEFNYGNTYLNSFRNFVYLGKGFDIVKRYDNNKSWVNGTKNRLIVNGFNNTNYSVSDEKLVLNTKNIDVHLNVGQGIVYDIWKMSKRFNYPLSGGHITIGDNNVDKTKTTINTVSFFEFAESFKNSFINARNRQTLSDGFNNGYPLLQKVFWDYLVSNEKVNIPNNKYTYQKMVNFINEIGDYWLKMLEQVIPASTLWNGGMKLDNNIFHRQKIVWRRQRGCQLVPEPCTPCYFNGQLFSYDCIDETFTCDLSNVDFNQTLNDAINDAILENNLNINDCMLNSLTSEWIIDISINNNSIYNSVFYNGFGDIDIPNKNNLENAISDGESTLNMESLSFIREDDIFMLKSIVCDDIFSNQIVSFTISINLNMVCE